MQISDYMPSNIIKLPSIIILYITEKLSEKFLFLTLFRVALIKICGFFSKRPKKRVLWVGSQKEELDWLSNLHAGDLV